MSTTFLLKIEKNVNYWCKTMSYIGYQILGAAEKKPLMIND